MHDHDQRFKALIQEFFEDFLLLFFANWAARLDCSKVEWLDKEVFPDPPEGARRVLDLVAKLPTRQGVSTTGAAEPEQWLALVHIEIESPDKATPLRPRMFRYYVHLRDKYGLPVLPIGLFLHVGLDGIGVDVYEEHFWELRPVQFQYLYVGLPGLDAVEYVQGANWLGVALAALMRIPREKVAWLGAEALRKISEAPVSDQQRYLLGECVQAYLALDDRQQREFEKLTYSPGFEKVKVMNLTWFDRGVEKGEAIGKEKGEAIGKEKGEAIGKEKGRLELMVAILETAFGPLPAEAEVKLQKMSVADLAKLGRKVGNADSLKALGLLD